MRAPLLGGAAKRIVGVTIKRQPPAFARSTFQDQWRRREGRNQPRPGDRDSVVLWPDTFTNHFDLQIGRAAVELLEKAGLRVAVPEEAVCCGLTWISTGQLTRVFSRTSRVLCPWLEAGTPIVILEPSCGAAFRSDARELLSHDEDAQRLRKQFTTFAKVLREQAASGWEVPEVGGRAIGPTHCHQHAVLGSGADEELVRRAGCDAEFLDSGCCGLAGNFGFEKGHYAVSMAYAERVLLPAVRGAAAGTSVLADGSSCRTQIEHGAPGNHPMHLAELLIAAERRSGIRGGARR